MNSPQRISLRPYTRRTKIVCTLGPASHSRERIDQLMRAGMDVVRINFSHGTRAQHATTIRLVRAASGRYQRPVAILADMPGPKIRTGALEGGQPVLLRAGQRFTISTIGRPGTGDGVSTTYELLPSEVRRGDRILLSDGLIELRVESSRRHEVICRVVNGGLLGEHKGVNLPGVRLSAPALTPGDLDDLAFALRCGVNYIGVSFVRTAGDVLKARAAVARAGSRTSIIAKLEKPEAIENLDSILRVADGVMIARGDLGVEMSPERVPVVQKTVIARAREARVPVITATQMLESMTKNPRPTRAEASDVANAVFDGSDALMLSGETAVGSYPIEAVKMMDRIIREAEANIASIPSHRRRMAANIADTTAELICHASEQLEMKVIAVFTETGSSARLISKYRPRRPIVAFSPNQDTRRQLSLFWGVTPRKTAPLRNVSTMARYAERRLLQERLVRRGDLVGIVAGIPFAIGGTTNFMKFHVVGSGTQG